MSDNGAVAVAMAETGSQGLTRHQCQQAGTIVGTELSQLKLKLAETIVDGKMVTARA